MNKSQCYFYLSILVVVLILVVLWIFLPVLRTFLVGTYGYTISVVAPIVLASFLGFMLQGRSNRRNYLENQRNLWLKKHNSEIAKQFKHPLKGELVNFLLDNSNLNFFTPKKEIVSFTNDDPSTGLKVELDISYAAERYPDPNVSEHMRNGYKRLDEEISTAIQHTQDLYPTLERLNKEIHESIKGLFSEKEPSLSPRVNYDENVSAYYLRSLVEAIYLQLKENIEGKNVTMFRDTDDRSSMRKIYFESTTVANFVNHQGASALTSALNGVYVPHAQQAKHLAEEVESVGKEWSKIYQRFDEIGRGFIESGIPLEGKCKVCQRTKDANVLVPYSCP